MNGGSTWEVTRKPCKPSAGLEPATPFLGIEVHGAGRTDR